MALKLIILGLLCAYGNSLTLVTVIVGDNPSAGIQLTGPAFDVAVRDANAKYNGIFLNVTRKLVYRPGPMSCIIATENTADVAGNMTALVTDTDDAVVLLSAEWNVLLLESEAGDVAFSNRDRYGSTVIFGPTDHAILAQATLFFIESFGWTTVSLICDRLTRNIASTGFGTFACSSIQKLLINGSGKYVVHINDFDAADTSSYRSILTKTAQESRIVLIYADLVVIRKFLTAAAMLGMTNGDYVYLSAQGLLTKISGEAIWRKNDTDDLLAFEAFKSFIVVNNQSPDWKKITKVVHDIAEESQKSYNHTCKPGEINDLTISAYETVISFAQRTANLPQQALKNGKYVAELFYNKTFSLDSREVYINQRGIRSSDVNFWKLNNATGIYERAWVYSRKEKRLLNASQLAYSWSHRDMPPQDAPACGFRHEICDLQSRTYLLDIALGSAIALVVCFGAVFLVLRAYREAIKRNRASWLLQSGSSSLDALKEDQIRGSSMSDSFLLHCQDSVRVYDGKLVWIESLAKGLTEHQLLSKNKAITIAAELKAMRHANIQEFCGVKLDGSSVCMLWSYAQRGSLRSFLDSERVSSELRIPMCWDVISGLQQLKRTRLRFHGRLSSITCMIDSRFSLRLCAAGTTRFFSCYPSSLESLRATKGLELWLAPETLQSRAAIGSYEADIFGLGIIMSEIVTGRYPMDVNFTNSLAMLTNEDVQDEDVQLHKAAEACGLRRFCSLLLDRVLEQSVSFLPSSSISCGTPLERFTVGAQMTSDVRTHLLAMMQHSPGSRPTLERTANVFAKSYPRSNAIANLLHRMEKFTEDLENQVGARSQDLYEETVKVDKLLCEIVPSTLVARLRNKLEISPETFDAVTMLFSALPHFPEICAQSSPAQIVILLNEIYVLFDHILTTCDAYKVETIKDSYMVVSGLPGRNGDMHAGQIARLALKMQKDARGIACPVRGNEGLVLRIGIHSGTCVATVIGRLMPRYCLFGDTVNTASRMESSCLPDKIQLSEATKSILDRTTNCELHYRGLVFIKGKGNMEIFWLENLPR